MADQNTSEMAQAIQDVTEKAQLLVREEIALAKAEVSDKATKLIKGAIFGVVAAIFLVFALIYLLHSLALGIWSAIGSDTNYWLGYLIVGVLLVLLGAIGGFDRDALREARLAAHAADGHRGGAAHQGHADRLAARAARRGGRRPAGARTGAQGGWSLMAATPRTPEEIRRSIEANRAELGLSLERLRAEVTEVTDWRKQLNKRRKEALIVAAAAGFVLGGGIAAIVSLLSGGDSD